jgi:hypothetical protein
MGFIRKAATFLFNKNSQKNSSVFNDLKTVLKSKLKFIIILASPVLIVVAIGVILLSNFDMKLGLLQSVDPNGSKDFSSGEVNLNYDFEDYYNICANTTETNNTPAEDLLSTEYGTVDNFNQHIKDSVKAAGFGTRSGVVASAVALVGDYAKATGKRLRYQNQPLRQEPGVEGIVNDNFYLDCSSLAWWALYNGGFSLPSCDAKAHSILAWGDSQNYLKTPGSGVGQPGDYLVNSKHIMLIVGTYDGGYYCAEEVKMGYGARIGKAGYSYAQEYSLLDMTDYYNDQNNVRAE